VRKTNRTAPACAALALAALGAALAWSPRPAEPANPSPALLAVERQGALLDEEVAVVHANLLRKEEIAAGLASGRLRLDEAVERVLALEAERPELWAKTRRWLAEAHPGRPIRECMARNLVRRALVGVRDDPPRMAALEARLGRELEGYLSRPEAYDDPDGR
jgi:hypothetical protein